MSLWLSSYWGYLGESNFIEIADGYSTNIKKVNHMLLHLAMPVFVNMNYKTRLEFLIEAKEQFDKMKELGFSFSIGQLFVLPLFYNKIDQLDVHQIYEESRCIFEKHPDIQIEAANKNSSIKK